MREKLIQYVNGLFASAGSSAQVRELHDEILQNTLDRFDDECAKGMDGESAYRRAVAGIGDVETILNACSPVRARSSRMYRTVGIMLYVFCVFPVMIGELFGNLGNAIGVFLMFAMAGTATALMVLSGAPHSRSRRLRAAGIGLYVLCPGMPELLETTVGGHVGDVLGTLSLLLVAAAATLLVVLPAGGGRRTAAAPAPQEASPSGKRVPRRAWRTWRPLYWIAAAVIFCALCSFGFWYYAWLVFIVAGAVGDIITGIVLLTRHGFGGRKLADGLLWLVIAGVYAVLTHQTGAWMVTWLLFPIGAALSGVIGGIAQLVKGEAQ